MPKQLDNKTGEWRKVEMSAEEDAALGLPEFRAHRAELERRHAEGARWGLVLDAMDPEVSALHKRCLDAMTFGRSRDEKGEWEPLAVVLERYSKALLGQLERELLHPLARHALTYPDVELVGIIPKGQEVR